MNALARALVLGVLAWTSLWSQDAAAESLLERHLAAIGGAVRLDAIQEIRIRGRQVLMPAPIELPMLLEQKRPNLQRMELTVRGMTEISTFNGTEGWVKTPWAANKEAEPLDPEHLQALAEHDFDTPYLNWKAKGWKAELLGDLVQEGRSLKRVQLTLSNTEAIIGTFDARTLMECQRERVYRELGNEIRIVTQFADYRTVQGRLFPFFILSRAAYRPGRLKLLIDSVEINPGLSGERFEKP